MLSSEYANKGIFWSLSEKKPDLTARPERLLHAFKPVSVCPPHHCSALQYRAPSHAPGTERNRPRPPTFPLPEFLRDKQARKSAHRSEPNGWGRKRTKS